MLNISASLSRSLFCITAIFHHASQPSISPTPFIILDHLDHGHPPSCLALAFGTNHRVHGRHFSLAPFRWANPRRVLGIGSLECVFHVSIFLHRYSGKFIIYIYISISTVKYIHHLQMYINRKQSKYIYHTTLKCILVIR